MTILDPAIAVYQPSTFSTQLLIQNKNWEDNSNTPFLGILQCVIREKDKKRTKFVWAFNCLTKHKRKNSTFEPLILFDHMFYVWKSSIEQKENLHVNDKEKKITWLVGHMQKNRVLSWLVCLIDANSNKLMHNESF